MSYLTISLEALLQKACSSSDPTPDTTIADAFCTLINKEKTGDLAAVKLLSQKIQSPNEREALEALFLLDSCMKQCSDEFRAEIGKFRFLNEMIKLVSPKYLGNYTPEPVQTRVISLLTSWMTEYPKEVKIKEAYEMLVKQRVIPQKQTGNLIDTDVASPALNSPKNQSGIFDDDEKSKLLQKLLRSKNPNDLQAANRLIKSMVKEDEQRIERSCLVQSIHNHVKLLNEMLDSYDITRTSQGELEIIKEVYQRCDRLKSDIITFELQNKFLEQDILDATVALSDLFAKYKRIMMNNSTISILDSELVVADPLEISLLTLESNSNVTSPIKKSIFDEIKPLFDNANVNVKESIQVIKKNALDDLDVLTDSLMKTLPVEGKFETKISLNQLKNADSHEATSQMTSSDLDYLERRLSLVDFDTEMIEDVSEEKCPSVHNGDKVTDLLDLHVRLSEIEPMDREPRNVIKDANGVCVVFHFAKVPAHDDICVVVVSTSNLNETFGLENYLFQAYVFPRTCKIKVEPASICELSPFKKFLPIATISQIVLIQNVENSKEISVKFVFSYTMNDELFTETGKVDL